MTDTDDLSKYEPEKLPPELRWKGPGDPPASWWATDKNGELTKVYRSYADYCDD